MTTTTTTTTTTPKATPEVAISYVEQRDALLRQSTANQGDTLKQALALFVHDFPTLAEVSAIVTANGGLKTTTSGKVQETRFTTIVLYIAQAGKETFLGLWDSVKVDDKLSPEDADLRRANAVLTVYNAMILVDKHSQHIKETAKFVRKS